jgi:peptide/nickel transport system substrate-binding protein
MVLTGPWFDGLRGGNFDVTIEGNCQSVVSPVLDVGMYQPGLVFTAKFAFFPWESWVGTAKSQAN